MEGERKLVLCKGDLTMLAAAVAVASLLMLATARPAYGVTVLQLINDGPFMFVAQFLLELIQSVVDEVMIPLCGTMFSWSTDYLSIPYVNTVIIGLQAISVTAVIALRVAKGITSGILLNGGNREASIGEYVYTSILAVIIVAIMPLLCNLVIHFGNLIFNDVVKGGTVENSLSWMSLEDFNFDEDVSAGGGDALVHTMLWLSIGTILMLALIVAAGYQFVRRQVEMLVISLIGPLVAVYAATENDNNQVYELLRKLFGLCCLMWIQYLLIRIALEFGHSWVNYAATTSASSLDSQMLATAMFSGEGAERLLFTLAFFGAALTMPNLLDQFTTASGGSRIGGVVVSAGVTRAIGGATKAPGKMAGGTVKTSGKAVKFGVGRINGGSGK